MEILSIQLLGRPEVNYGQQPLSFRTRKVLALLIYLVVERGMHTRESLMTLFWPETEPQKATVTLRGTLSRLRRALKPAGDVLLTEAGKVGFDFNCPIDLDLDWLSVAASPGREGAETAVISPDQLGQILKLDRGEFLTDFSLPDTPGFDAWVTIQREVYQRGVEAVYDRLTRHQLESGQAEATLETASRWLVRAPLNETAYRRLMTAQALAGDRAGALSTYAKCRAAWQTELGISPATETAALAERIRTESLAAPPSSSSVPLSAQLPFVGRADEHSQLVAAFRQPGMRICVLIGAGGVGKTRLIQAFLEWAAMDTPELDIWQGRAFEMGGRLSYEPVIEALRQRLELENAPEDLLEDVWLAELSQLMPELRGRYPDLPLPMTGNANFVRSRLFAAVTMLGSELAARRPAIFVLDDMQWADADTRDLVQYAARHWAENDAPILLLLAVRQEAFAAESDLREWVARLSRDVPLERLLLESLNGTAVETLITKLANPASSKESTRAFAEWLWAETNGLPFFIEALLKMLVEQGVLTENEARGQTLEFASALRHVRSVGHVPVPPGVRDVLLARLEQLSEAETALLLATAVMGRECSLERLCQVADVGETEGLIALEALLNGRLLLEKGSARRPYMVAHDHIREVVYNESREARRRLWHRRALIGLEADGAPAAQCAFHAVASLLDEPSFRYSLAAGDEAMSKHALSEAFGHYETAQQLLLAGHLQQVDTVVIQHLYLQIGRVQELLNEFDKAWATYQQMIELAAQRADERLKLASLTAQCIVRVTHTPLYDMAKAQILGEEALELAQRLGDKATEAKVLWGLLLVQLLGDGNYHKGLEYGLRSLELARELDLKEQMGFTYQDMTRGYLKLNQLADAKRVNQEALEIWQALGNLPMLIDANTMQHLNHFLAGELESSLTVAEEALRLSRSIDHAWGQVASLGFLIVSLTEIGDPGRTAAMLRERERIVKAIGSGFHMTYTYLIRVGQLYLALSLGERGPPAAHLAEELYENRHDLIPYMKPFMMAGVIQFKVIEGNLEQAQQIFDDISSDTVGPLTVAELYILLAQNNLQLAVERAQDIVEQLRQAGSRVYLPEVLWLQGKALIGLKQWTQAQKTLTEALKISRENGERRLRWRILAGLAEIAQESGNQSEAVEYRKMGQEVVTYIADHIDDAELRARFLEGTAVRQLFPANR